MRNDHRFFTGPEFLRTEADDWLHFRNVATAEENDGDLEIRETNWVGAVQQQQLPIDQTIEHSSRLNHLVRKIAYVLRWIKSTRAVKEERKSWDLSTEEIQLSRQTIIRLAQDRFYFSELEDLKSRRPINSHSKILKLKLFLDHRGLLCVEGRIDDTPVAYDIRHPIILPASARFTELIVYQTHLEYAHASPERTLHECQKIFLDCERKGDSEENIK